MVSVEDALSLYQCLSNQGIQIWLSGGWGIDALLGEQTRPHKDLDVIMLLDDVARMLELLGGDGYSLEEIWSENRWVKAADGVEIPTAFVLQDATGRQVDAHALVFDRQGNGIPAWEDAEGLIFRQQDLAGIGKIGGKRVSCLSPEMQVQCHGGYALPESHVRDLERLKRKYQVELP